MQSEVNKRRKQRQKQARKRRLAIAFISFFVLSIIVALVTLVVMCFTVFFDVKQINVSGSEIYSNAEVIKASGITTEDNLLVISEKKLEEKIRQSLPYVDDVKIKRRLPDKVALIITDAKEYAYYAVEGKYYVISENGYILKEQTEAPENVFEIITSGISGNVGEKVVFANSTEENLVNELITLLEAKEININKINVTSQLEIKLFVENRFEVVIGDNKYLTEKIAHLSGMIGEIPDRSGMIDLSMWTPEKSQGSFVENKE